jgi:hypothetical protein
MDYKMKSKNNLMLGFVLIIFLAGGVFAEVSHCCEKTDVRDDGSGGIWCVDSDVGECDTNYAMEPTACISTSYCRQGTCVNRKDGECVENTPSRGCDPNLGFWSESSPEDIPQCQLGCCFIGDQAAFVTQTKCKGFASLYGIDTNFQKNIQNEITCIASAQPDVLGACVYEREFEKTCKMLKKAECTNFGEDTSFFEGVLCTANELATNCAPTVKTTCVEDKDEVFFLDSCGNLANVYDSSMIKEVDRQILPSDGEGEAYWKNILPSTCGTSPNSNSPTCGDCNYYDGSTCKIYDKNEDSVKPNYGDNVCRSLDCSFDANKDGEKETYLHGESWCAESLGRDLIDVEGGKIKDSIVDNLYVNLPGSRYFRMVCYNGEVTIEPCADLRAEVCIQGKIVNERTEALNVDGFRTSRCRVNKWQDCAGHTEEEECNDLDQRDCQWIKEQEDCVSTDREKCLGRCAPLFAPGFSFWEEESEEEAGICGSISTTCGGVLEKTLAQKTGKKDLTMVPFVTTIGKAYDDIRLREGAEIKGSEDCYELNDDKDDLEYLSSWGENLNQICVSMGDCQGRVSGKSIPKTTNYWGFD